MRIQIVAFINHYQLKWLPGDILILADSINHGMGAGEYDTLLTFFGIEPSTINVGIAALELIYLGVLFYQRTVEREAKRSKGSLLN